MAVGLCACRQDIQWHGSLRVRPAQTLCTAHQIMLLLIRDSQQCCWWWDFSVFSQAPVSPSGQEHPAHWHPNRARRCFLSPPLLTASSWNHELFAFKEGSVHPHYQWRFRVSLPARPREWKSAWMKPALSTLALWICTNSRKLRLNLIWKPPQPMHFKDRTTKPINRDHSDTCCQRLKENGYRESHNYDKFRRCFSLTNVGTKTLHEYPALKRVIFLRGQSISGSQWTTLKYICHCKFMKYWWCFLGGC